MNPRVPDPLLRAELVRRRDVDQQARHALSEGAVDWAAVAEVDADNLAFLEPHIARHGWLGSDLVGGDGAQACWLMVQHAPPERQEEWLRLMQAAVLDGHAEKRDLVYLQDRVNMHAGRPQTHGTQWLGFGEVLRLWPVVDPEGLNERRLALELRPLTDEQVAGVWTAEELAAHGQQLHWE